ncbi:hypothetical protein PHLCEN_2v13144 [Hermanssonia centrifuga]|uniref:Uncharacterized protein n=1 Tax=Hermanssonia centrifuga TaxID=98765 RepID=A0A2R6NFD1_9APHY|nr:hypothetical protein PHLCEN_2v13144 [Hermanssonia centrifuga]
MDKLSRVNRIYPGMGNYTVSTWAHTAAGVAFSILHEDHTRSDYAERSNPQNDVQGIVLKIGTEEQGYPSRLE